jgi:signal transduction histidine kinase
LFLQEIKNKPTSKSVEEAQRIASEAQEELRRISLNLHPQVLSDFGLKRALEWRIQRFSEHAGVHVDFACPEIPRDSISPQAGITAYRIVQEALTNVAKHSGASKASVNVQLDGDLLCLVIRDSGKGFAPEKINSALSSGLRGMNDRATLEGGTFEIVSAPGKGAQIKVTLPAKKS